jgi:hypothetical protein
MRYVIDEKTLDKVLHPYFDLLLKTLHPFEDEINVGWKVSGEDDYIFMYDNSSSKLDKSDRILFYWGAFFESAEHMFKLKWYTIKDSLERYLRNRNFKFKGIS